MEQFRMKINVLLKLYKRIMMYFWKLNMCIDIFKKQNKRKSNKNVIEIHKLSLFYFLVELVKEFISGFNGLILCVCVCVYCFLFVYS